MTYFSVIFLCNALLFMTLLNDRFRTLASVVVMAVTYGGSLILSAIVKSIFKEIATQNLICILLNVILLFVVSLFLYKNNLMHKIYLSVLVFVNFFFITLVTELMLGILPVKTAGIAAAIISILIYVLFTLLMTLSLYSVYHYFSERSVSGFGIGITIIQLLPFFFCTNKFNFLFRSNPLEGGLFYSALLYIFIIFAWRSIYHAAKYKERTTEFDGYQKLIDAESARFADMATNVKAIKNEKSSLTRALDTINVMIKDGNTDKVPRYIDIIKENSESLPVMKNYSDNPYISAVISTNALKATSQDMLFESATTPVNRAFKTSELCIMTDEILRKAISEASDSEAKQKRIRFTISQASSAVNIEAVYTAELPEHEKFSLRGKSFSDILNYLFDENEEKADLDGLELTEEIIRRYSGKLGISSADSNIILRAIVNY